MMSLRRAVRILKVIGKGIRYLGIGVIFAIICLLAFSLASMMWIVYGILNLSKEQRALIMDSLWLIFYVGLMLYIWGSNDALITNVADAFLIFGSIILIALQTERIGNDLLAIQIGSIKSREDHVNSEQEERR